MIGHSFFLWSGQGSTPTAYFFSLNILFFNIGVGVLFVFW